MNRPTPTPCPRCGAPLEAEGAPAACPACLMSGVLRADPGAEAETIVYPPPGKPRDRGEGRFPRELGDYTLQGLLGRGGMGTVYEAVQRSTGRRLALKLLEQSLDSPDMRRRFLREGRLAARVNHPASLYVFGSEEIDGSPAITMEIAPGGTLHDVLRQRGPLPVAEAVDAVLSIIDGLEAAYDRGVLHRDIKPSNCFVSPDGTVQVGDFGLSVSTLPSSDTFVTQTGRAMGTPAFASPEQLRGDEVDVRSDIYAVGATLFTLLTGRPPFEGDNAVQVVAQVIDSPPASAARFRDDLPPGLNPIVARCLVKEPAARYDDYTALRDALLPFSSTVPEPATQAQRTAAGWIDYLTALLPLYAVFMLTVGPEALWIRPLYEFTPAAWRYQLMVFAAGVLYFTLFEGLWGTGLGKWVMNLRVVRKNGRAPGIGRALLRAAIPIAAIEAVRVPLSVACLPAGDWSLFNVLLFIGLSIVCPWVVALLWITARRGNGFATVWDLATGTRVVVRPRGTSRPTSFAATDTKAEAEPAHVMGPFRVTETLQPDRWLEAEDPTLDRRVWLIRRAGSPPSEARRGVARPGRPRWLQAVETAEQVWDAYSASGGTPFPELMAKGRVPWSTLRYWLYDLADELRAAQRDGSLPSAYRLDQIWITDDGRALLLDEPWPGTTPTHEGAAEPMAVDQLEGQQRFLQAVAERVDPLSVPLHARPALDNLRHGTFEKLTYLTGTLRGLLNKPADVTRGIRAASLLVIPGYAWIATFLGIASNTDPAVGPLAWAGRVAIAGLVMTFFIALFDFALAFWNKSTGLTTFGLEAVTLHGRASRARMLLRSAVMWLPTILAGAVLTTAFLTNAPWFGFNTTAALGVGTLACAAVWSASALINPTRGLHDRLAGAWVGRR